MNDIKQLGVKVLAMDVTDEASMVNCINTIITNEGRIDVLVNNAGFGSYGAVENVSMNDARYQLEVNVIGAARLSQLVIPTMRNHKFGRIINISSIGGKFATPFGGWYHASKFALEGLSDSLRNEVKQFGIDVVVIEPGGVKSEWSSIANQSLVKNADGTHYSNMAKKAIEVSQKTNDRNAEPIVIVNLVRKAIEAKKPRTRYVGGFLAKPLIFFRKILTDRMLDGLIMSQLK